jgi:hypothetical protein
MPSEKMFWLSDKPLLSLLGHWRNGGLSKLMWAAQTGDRRSQIRIARREAFNGVGGSVQTGIAALQYLSGTSPRRLVE